jgi:GTP-binding protein
LPEGTVVKDIKTSHVLADLDKPEKEVLVAKGGKGGRGNARFKSSINQIPRKADDGIPGESFKVSLELKSIADVGLVGFPNAGKSTLLARLSKAHPKIADYPFTTKVPNLGIVPLSEYRSFVMADIPGLIEGASMGKGMGIQFLRHIQRTRILVYMIDVSTDNIEETLRTLQDEMASFDKELPGKPSLIAINKIDLFADRPVKYDKFDTDGLKICQISAVTGENIEQLLNMISELLDANK